MQKNKIERLILLTLFLSSCIAITNILDNNEWTPLEQKHHNMANIQKDIENLFNTYKIESKCITIICTNDEIKRIHKLLKHNKNQYKSQQNQYTLYFKCYSILCYEFIRSLENEAIIFIHEIESLNVTIINDFDNTYKEIQDSIIESQFDMDNTKQLLDSLNVKWNQDMRIVFEINNIGIINENN